MAAYSKDLLVALRPVIAVARSYLDSLDADEIPENLRRVRQSSARTLPPPLSRKLLEALDGDGDLRARVAAHSDDLPAVARAFLEREAAWWVVVSTAVADEVDRAAQVRIDDVTRRIPQLEAFVAEARERAAQAVRQEAQAREEARAKVEAARSRLKDLAASEGARSRTDTEHTESLERRVADLEDDVRDLTSVVAAQRERLGKRRRVGPRVVAEGRGSLPAEPLAMARALDHQLEMAARAVARGHEADPSPRAARALALPAGVSPDSPDALKWLMAAPAATVIVDGYNVLFKAVTAGAASGTARSRLEAALQRLHVQSANRHSVIVVYDSTLSGDSEPRPRAKGLEVRFVTADRLADEEIDDLAGRIEGPVVVVSSDREVREAATEAGAVSLWAEALVPLVSGV